jgi:3-dehydroquinate synthase
MSAPARLRVELGERSYDVLVGNGLIDEADRHLAGVIAEQRVFVVTDENLARTHWSRLERALTRAGIAHPQVVLPPGEHTKSFAQLERVLDAILAHRPERRSILVALGGGVIGDLVGLAASLLLRGVDFVQIPTTLLAQVDSAVGGKTGIDTRHGKNLVGSFHQPRLVLADLDALATLPPRELHAGYAEIVKYGLIDDAPFFAWLEANGPALLSGDRAAQAHAVVTSLKAKARIVAADEREGGVRALLNLGHTFAHAVEAALSFDGLLHGEAVGLGMRLALDVSARLGLCPQADAERVRAHVARNGLPTRVPQGLGADRLIALMGQDKKVADGRITFILARGIGRSFVARDVPLATVREALVAAGAA